MMMMMMMVMPVTSLSLILHFCASTASFIIHNLLSSFIIRHLHTVDGCEIHQLRYSRWFIPCLSHYWWGFNHYYHSFLFTIITINYHYSLVDRWFIHVYPMIYRVSTCFNHPKLVVTPSCSPLAVAVRRKDVAPRQESRSRSRRGRDGRDGRDGREKVPACKRQKGDGGFQYIWGNYNDLTATSLESWLIRGIIPTWPYFRLVNYCNLPRYMGSIPINTIFRGMNIHKSHLFWCELQGYKVLTHCHMDIIM